MKGKILNVSRVIALSFVFSAAIGYSLAAWTPPTVAPPGGNPEPPINTSITAQIKTGNLGVNILTAANSIVTPSLCLSGDCRSTWPTGGGGGGLSGAGTVNYIPKWTGGSALGNSQIFDNGTNVGVGLGAVAPNTKLDVNGDVRVRGSNVYMGTGGASFYGDTTNLAARQTGSFVIQNAAGTALGTLNVGKICLGASPCITTWPSGGGGGLTGGVANTIPKWTSGTTIGNSRITDNGTVIALNGNASVSGSLDMTAGKVVNLAIPTVPSDAANKAYVDARVRVQYIDVDNCGQCPYGYSEKSGQRACKFKNRNLTVIDPYTLQQDPYGSQTWQYICYSTRDRTAAFWSY